MGKHLPLCPVVQPSDIFICYLNDFFYHSEDHQYNENKFYSKIGYNECIVVAVSIHGISFSEVPTWMYISLSFPPSLPPSLPTNLPTYLPNYLPTYLPTYRKNKHI